MNYYKKILSIIP